MGKDFNNKVHLFAPLKIRGVNLKNRIAVSPMCQYSSQNDGHPEDWHLVHLGSRAVGGAGLVFSEATAVNPEGRISPWDLGIWRDEHIPSFSRITDFIKSQNSVPGIQIAHAGRKASRETPWNNGDEIRKENGGWQTVGPSPLSFSQEDSVPKELTKQEINQIIEDFTKAAERSIHAGFEVIELHFAHGYLVCEFMSPLSNIRTDEFGGELENRIKLPIEICNQVRKVVPSKTPLFVRISADEYVKNGWDLEQSIYLSIKLKEVGVDLIDCSSGGNSFYQKLDPKPGYQVNFAKEVRLKSKILTGAVGLITDPEQADEIIQNEEADLVFLGRELLRNPYWPMYAEKTLNKCSSWPDQYLRVDE